MVRKPLKWEVLQAFFVVPSGTDQGQTTKSQEGDQDRKRKAPSKNNKS